MLLSYNCQGLSCGRMRRKTWRPAFFGIHHYLYNGAEIDFLWSKPCFTLVIDSPRPIKRSQHFFTASITFCSPFIFRKYPCCPAKLASGHLQQSHLNVLQQNLPSFFYIVLYILTLCSFNISGFCTHYDLYWPFSQHPSGSALSHRLQGKPKSSSLIPFSSMNLGKPATVTENPWEPAVLPAGISPRLAPFRQLSLIFFSNLFKP